MPLDCKKVACKKQSKKHKNKAKYDKTTLQHSGTTKNF